MVAMILAATCRPVCGVLMSLLAFAEGLNSWYLGVNEQTVRVSSDSKQSMTLTVEL